MIKVIIFKCETNVYTVSLSRAPLPHVSSFLSHKTTRNNFKLIALHMSDQERWHHSHMYFTWMIYLCSTSYDSYTDHHCDISFKYFTFNKNMWNIHIRSHRFTNWQPVEMQNIAITPNLGKGITSFGQKLSTNDA